MGIDNFNENASKRMLAENFEKKLKARQSDLKNNNIKAKFDFFNDYKPTINNIAYKNLVQALAECPDSPPSEYIKSNMNWIFDGFIDSKHRDMILYFADRIREYPYMTSYNRRPYRSKKIYLYAQQIASILTDVYNYSFDAPLSDILNRNAPEEMQAYLDLNPHRIGYSDWQIAYALDMGDKDIEEAVYRIITEDNSSSLLTRCLVSGILKSHRSDFHQLIGKLLLAARLQEGLRQVICESADFGTLPAFLTILQVIDENNLIRFSSVKRAVGTWLGLISDESGKLERISDKSIRLILDCIENNELKETYLSCSDAMKTYISLWSYAVEDVDKAIEKTNKIIDEDNEHNIKVAGYFINSLEDGKTATELAIKVIDRYFDKPDILSLWVHSYIPYRTIVVYNLSIARENSIVTSLYNLKDELYAHYKIIKKAYDAFEGKKKSYTALVFPWDESKISKSDFSEIICILAACCGDEALVDECCPLYKECDAGCRYLYFKALMSGKKTEAKRKQILEAFSDKESDTRRTAYEIINGLSLSPQEYQSIENNLRFKLADVRAYTINILLKQNDNYLCQSIDRLLKNPKEEMRLGALDIINQLRNDKGRNYIANKYIPTLFLMANDPNLTSKEKILVQALVPQKAKTKINDLSSLYQISDKYLPQDFDNEYLQLCCEKFKKYFPDSEAVNNLLNRKSSVLKKLKNAISKPTKCKTAQKAHEDIMSLCNFINENREKTYINFLGAEVMVGSLESISFSVMDIDKQIPLKEIWDSWAKREEITKYRSLRMSVLFLAYQTLHDSDIPNEYIRELYGNGFECFNSYTYENWLNTLLPHFTKMVPQEDLQMLASTIAYWFIKCVPDENIIVTAPLRETYDEPAHILFHKQIQLVFYHLFTDNNKYFDNSFALGVAAANRCREAALGINKTENNKPKKYLNMTPRNSLTYGRPHDIYTYHNCIVWYKQYIHAVQLGIISEKQFHEFLLRPENLNHTLDLVSLTYPLIYDKDRNISQKYYSYKQRNQKQSLNKYLGDCSEDNFYDEKLLTVASSLYNEIIPIILSHELSRGDSPEKYSENIFNILRLYGASNFTSIINSLGNDTIERSVIYGYGNYKIRKHTLSYLLSVCVPDKNDDVNTLRKCLEGKNISKKRLIEASMFSPEWIPIIGEYLGIESYESICYYFMAHMNEKFDDKRKAIIARYTPLSEEELNLGAFDVNWFKSAYSSVGEKEFNLIYDSAKYISDGIKHSRARKFADAALGKFSIDELEATITDKRNKDLLMAYSLLPINNEDDIKRRYLFIQKFHKESKKFGSQRIVSEGKAVEMALINLASNSGYTDSMRLTLRMESKVVEDTKSLLEEIDVEDISVQLIIGESGKTELVAKKNGKELKSLPQKLKKNETIIKLNEFKKTLNEQYRRTRLMLEEAMENSTFFTFSELKSLTEHPVVYPMLKNLVMISGDNIGFLSSQGLADFKGVVCSLEESNQVRLAHPFDLYKSGCWREYQKYLFDNQIIQPFKQVFRELYVKTNEELETYHSERYSGNQIQPAKTVGALKNRRWIADIESGLQKIYYKENIVATICAMADWFTPADIEAPTLEWVSFYDRNTGKELKISQIPDIIFSEVMRDVDLAVSVAHAGGVDPETSHSTMEMRSAILSFVIPMFRLNNVKLKSNHAFIKGELAEYSVHLGSGVVHQVGGAMIPVLPVHSQHRGRVFLPFVDDDPKTSEIITKVLLFAEDKKIKDPTILANISRY